MTLRLAGPSFTVETKLFPISRGPSGMPSYVEILQLISTRVGNTVRICPVGGMEYGDKIYQMSPDGVFLRSFKGTDGLPPKLSDISRQEIGGDWQIVNGTYIDDFTSSPPVSPLP